MGRPTKGLDHVDRVEGSEYEKQRLKVVLLTLLGDLSVKNACLALEIGEKRFQQLRQDCLQAAVDALAPGYPGRPSGEVGPEVEALRADVLELEDLVRKQSIVLQTIAEDPSLAERMPKYWGLRLPDGGEEV